ncbi:adenosine 3'-phospho 5'-phosphosulfate transporter 2 [Scaptodrosophila lebanonensis]|uniref:Adenosine 3'-phospho 5'-phosphosulfate transporter 2 n=1 Tax=Drosophila lebanonensis TaxID=7225 RepID=A0A6J2UCM1_DROLE|nr:adenosine 3'-phospho 5'-phosphosulfate transporter 2 [Scaptodrosophila lebanonensis]XP_030385193.1 adenosine 3'-phospho 5'-phosphosulfate transporter 2 [Scaptodrosophila lebanonensis]XP_030385194.1 adenosine 3'-phospho 5'-phosphosulfate transporter 2 [Scaptodrosophila lebanonensis]
MDNSQTGNNVINVNGHVGSTNNNNKGSQSGLQQRKSSSTESPPELRILCFELTYYNRTTQFLLSCAGVFILYIIYGYLQELIFTVEGFKPYGWFLTLVQFGYYICFGLVEHRLEAYRASGGKWNSEPAPRCIPMRTYFVLAGLTLGTMGLSNSSLGYLNYPTQVIFKCCKLIPVLVGSILIQGKRYGPLDFAAAGAMCIGLAWFTLADSQLTPNFNPLGVAMISGALLCDAVIGNVQEKAMREFKAPSSEVVFYSYGLGFVYLLVIMLITGNFFSGFAFCIEHPLQSFGYGFLFSLSGYLGMQFVLALVRSSGAPVAATVTTARKAVTIAISFLFFTKPFTMQYLWSGLVVVLGIYLSVYSKRNKLTFTDLRHKFKQLSVRIARSPSRRFLIEV